ncbi:MAG: helix-turn-helix domain-containing protein [Alphaproteobacteria bacterium]|nr:helix-turn-helix domain-containing protein [Alphaproteobacteria bacterium]
MEEIIFPNKIRILRKMAGKSMQELADKLDVSLSAISKIEKGYRKINQEQMMVVSDFLGCSLNDIFISEDKDDETILNAWKQEIDRRVDLNENKGLKIFGAGLRYIRSGKNLTLMDVAEATGLTLSIYHRIEIGQREVYEDELADISKALGMSSKELLGKIFDLKKNGTLDNIINAEKPAESSITKLSDIIKTTESVYTPGGVVKFHKVLLHSKSLENGNILVDKEARDSYTIFPITADKPEGVYAVELSSRRLGTILPMRSILFVDPAQQVRSGDLAAQIVKQNDSSMEIKLISLREDVDGKFYAVSYNPDEKAPISDAAIAKLHKIVLVSMN